MKINFTIIIIFLLFCFKSFSQQASNLKTENVFSLPEERIYMHLDKENYYPGENIWYKAYLMEGNQAMATATNLYTQLINNEGKIILQNNTPIFQGSSSGSILIPDSLTNNVLFLRAFTENISSADTDYIFTRLINIINNDSIAINSDSTSAELKLQFFAESGNWVQDIRTLISFKASYPNGLPGIISGTIKTNTGDSVCSFNTLPNGMGEFTFTPEKNKNYYAEWQEKNGNTKRAYLPTAKEKGVALHIEKSAGAMYYIINNTEDDFATDTLLLTVFLQGQLIYKAYIDMSGDNFLVTGKIRTDSFPSGKMTFYLTNKYQQRIAERSIFLNNNNYSFTATINSIEKSVDKRGKNKIEIAVLDSVPTNMSLSIIAIAGEQDVQVKNSIIPNLLFASETNQSIYHLNNYLLTGDTVNQQLDALMLNTIWRQNTEAVRSLYFKQTNKYLTLQFANSNKMRQADESLNIILQEKTGEKHIYNIPEKADGSFTLDNVIFFDTAIIRYKLNNRQGNNINISISKAQLSFLNTTSIVNTWAIIKQKQNPDIVSNMAGHNLPYQGNTLDKAKMMKTVVIKSKIKKQEFETDRKYTNGFFSGGANTVAIDVLNDPFAEGYTDIFSYIAMRLGLIDHTDGTGRKIFLDKFHHAEIKNIYIDEHPYGSDLLQNLSVNEIAYIKYFKDPFFSPSAEDQYGTAIAIYTRKPGDVYINGKDNETAMVTKKIMGYPEEKEFYSPDYSKPSDKNFGVDMRSTLYWNPYILTDSTNKRVVIDFYNNDYSKKILLVLEGMNDDGKLIHIEKIIE